MSNETDRESSNIKIVSRDLEVRWDERRCLPRVCLTREQFRLTQTGKIFSVTDLSQNGIGFWLSDSKDLVLFILGSTLEGTLNLHRQKHSIQIKVKNLSQQRVGAVFENLSLETKKAIEQFLSPNVLGAELKPMPSYELSTLWYHGPSGTDLILHRSADGQIERITLYVFGSYVQWDHHQGVCSGRVMLSHHRSEVRGMMRFETLLLFQDGTLDGSKLEIAKTVILSSNLPQDLKSRCVRKLKPT